MCWNAFVNVNEDIVGGVKKLGRAPSPSDETVKAIEKFICELYVPKTTLTSVKDLQWWLFRKKQAQSERLYYVSTIKSQYRTKIFSLANLDIQASPENYGWEKDNNTWLPVITKLPPVPESIIHLVKCGCTKQCASNQSQCRKNAMHRPLFLS